jgi:hypothetical protein
MDTITLSWIRANTKQKFQSDIWIAEFFNKQRNDKEYLNKVKTELTKDIKRFETLKEIVGDDFLQKRNDELKYINYLIKN